MNCLNPLRIVNPKKKEVYKAMYKRHPRLLPHEVDAMFISQYPDDGFVDVPCGKCESCLTRKANEWSFRLFNEYANSDNCVFITLTYHDGALPHTNEGTPCFCIKDCQNFIKRLRKHYGNGLRYFLVSEYGSQTERPHYHMLLFNLPIDMNIPTWLYDVESVIYSKWQKGNVVVDKVCDERIIYCSKYCLSSLDIIDNDKLYQERRIFRDPYGKKTLKNFILASRNPCIGYQFLEQSTMDYYRETLDTKCVAPNGISYPMSRIYKDKIFDDSMKADIADKIKAEWKEVTSLEKEAYRYKIRKNFKKSHKL